MGSEVWSAKRVKLIRPRRDIWTGGTRRDVYTDLIIYGSLPMTNLMEKTFIFVQLRELGVNSEEDIHDCRVHLGRKEELDLV